MTRTLITYFAASVVISIIMELLKREGKVLKFQLPVWLRLILPVVMGACIMPFALGIGTLFERIIYGVVAGFSSTWTYDLYKSAAKQLVEREVQ